MNKYSSVPYITLVRSQC